MEDFFEHYDAALVLAARAHRDQRRKGSDVPYLIHPVHVSTILLRHGFPEELILAGLLHDVVEDADIPLADIEARFGPSVAEVVKVLTEQKRENDVERPWEVRKQESLERLLPASPGALAVKAADVLHNARSLARQVRDEGPSVWDYYTRGPEQSMWYYRSVAEMVGERLGAHPLARELDKAVEALEQAIADTEDR